MIADSNILTSSDQFQWGASNIAYGLKFEGNSATGFRTRNPGKLPICQLRRINNEWG